MSAIDHLDLVVTSLERSLAFYRGLLMPLGYVRVSEIVGERGEQVLYLGRVGGTGVGEPARGAVGRSRGPLRPLRGRPAPPRVQRLLARGVDDRAGWLREQGAVIESGPREYDYTPGYYAVFFYDPDGIKLEIVHKPSEGDLVAEVRRLEARLARLEQERRLTWPTRRPTDGDAASTGLGARAEPRARGRRRRTTRSRHEHDHEHAHGHDAEDHDHDTPRTRAQATATTRPRRTTTATITATTTATAITATATGTGTGTATASCTSRSSARARACGPSGSRCSSSARPPIAQLVVFVASGSVALLADLIHNFGDAATAIPLAIAFALRSARAERIAGLAVVLAIFVSACVAGYEAIDRLIDPHEPTHLTALALAGIVGFAGNWWAAIIRTRAGRRLDSPALVADGAHARADAYVSLAVVASALAVGIGLEIADPLIGLGITLVILKITRDSWVTVRGAAH